MMSATSTKPLGWPRRQWWGLVGLALVVQLGLICWLGDRDPVRPRPPAAAPTLQQADVASNELLALTDPTLFVLPHEHGFAGEAWLRVPPQAFHPFAWPEASCSLELRLEPLGASFQRLLQTNRFERWQTTPRPEPELVLPGRTGPEPAAQRSSFRFAGELAGRRLLTTLALPAWPAKSADLLTNSIVQLVVNAEGRPVSTTLLVRSGDDDADEYALVQARAARFAPAATTLEKLPQALVGLSWGELVCQWQTLPRPLTNGASGP